MFPLFYTGVALFLAIWGTIFMGILGGLYYNQSVGLFEDLPPETTQIENKDWSARVKNFDNLYQQNAYNCWVACAVYIGIIVVLSIRVCCFCSSKP